ncbi:MAG: hypothetical protein BWZ09_02628 [Alphaproteobacteria bacterium ADurb.BinA305]|nr:MAG: hypothetical protein BWZ09_02628 [Alphaproteobacteria bacterium ADurb.BinA305]
MRRACCGSPAGVVLPMPVPADSSIVRPPTVAVALPCDRWPSVSTEVVPLRLLRLPASTTSPTESMAMRAVSKPMYSIGIGWSARTLPVTVVLLPVVTKYCM